jgi:hypothetical protein
MVVLAIMMMSCADNGGENDLQIVARPDGVTLRVERLVEAEFPAAFAFHPVSSLLWYAELETGRLIEGVETRWDLAVSSGGESGLMSIAFSTDGAYLFAYVSVPQEDPSDSAADGGEAGVSRVIRLTVPPDGSLDKAMTILEVPSTGMHNAGSVGVGPDDLLYVNIGDNATLGESQSLRSPFGKILRLSLDGAPAPGNPFASDPDADPRVFTYGIRNTTAFAWLADGRLIGAENGDTADDEVNELLSGRNYGWPDGTNGEEPLRVFRETIAPAGIAGVPADFGDWAGARRVLLCGFVSREMWLVELDGSGAPLKVVDGCSLHLAAHPAGGVAFSNEEGIWRLTAE